MKYLKLNSKICNNAMEKICEELLDRNKHTLLARAPWSYSDQRAESYLQRENGGGTKAGKECVCFAEQAAPTKETYGQVFQRIHPCMSQFGAEDLCRNS